MLVPRPLKVQLPRLHAFLYLHLARLILDQRLRDGDQVRQYCFWSWAWASGLGWCHRIVLLVFPDHFIPIPKNDHKGERGWVTDVARRIEAILVLGPTLDANYNAVKLTTWDLGKSAKA